jgi:hypothetical protein
MADMKKSTKAAGPNDEAARLAESERKAEGKSESTEWLRDQTGEDHNLSGSSTYRNLPDQPASKDDDSVDGDSKRRASHR